MLTLSFYSPPCMGIKVISYRKLYHRIGMKVVNFKKRVCISSDSYKYIEKDKRQQKCPLS